MSFLGFRRSDGSVGVRNYIGIISTVSCANDLSWWIHNQIKGTAPFLHQAGCSQMKVDLNDTARTLISVGKNPNLAGVLLVSLGCEGVPVDLVEEGIAKSGKPVKREVIQRAGATSALKEGLELANEMVAETVMATREEFDDSYLVIGVKCGASDTTSGLAANPAIGATCDLVIDRGGTCVFGETTEFMGAEHILARRAISPEVANRIFEIVDRLEKRVIARGGCRGGGQPTAGNIAGGLTTIEEKSLGAISKGGTKPIRKVYEYGDRVEGRGLFIVDSPGREPEFLTALAAAGVQIVLFSTGLGAPQGFPFMPVIKVTGNPITFTRLQEHIDIFVDLARSGVSNLQSTAQTIYQEVLEVASGRRTKAEILGYGNFPGLNTLGPVI